MSRVLKLQFIRRWRDVAPIVPTVALVAAELRRAREVPPAMPSMPSVSTIINNHNEYALVSGDNSTGLAMFLVCMAAIGGWKLYTGSVLIAVDDVAQFKASLERHGLTVADNMFLDVNFSDKKMEDLSFSRVPFVHEISPEIATKILSCFQPNVTVVDVTLYRAVAQAECIAIVKRAIELAVFDDYVQDLHDTHSRRWVAPRCGFVLLQRALSLQFNNELAVICTLLIDQLDHWLSSPSLFRDDDSPHGHSATRHSHFEQLLLTLAAALDKDHSKPLSASDSAILAIRQKFTALTSKN